MKKIYFAPNWGLTSEQMVQDYIKQSPNNSGVWSNITYTVDENEADYVVVQDQCDPHLIQRFEKEKILYFSREAMTPQIQQFYPPSQVSRNSFWDGTNILWTKWWYPNKSSGGIGLTYDQLKKEQTPPKKSDILSCVQSDKRMTYGHVLRHDFLGKFMSLCPNLLDLYGPISYANKELDNNDKTNALDSYKYTLAFDNQDIARDFFGTQFTDAILRWCVPIYWGGADLEKYFPKKSFLKIDITKDHQKVVEDIVKFIEQDDYESRIDDIRKARKLILDRYNMWPVLERVINK
jgi:hypothetical protein